MKDSTQKNCIFWKKKSQFTSFVIKIYLASNSSLIDPFLLIN